MQLKPLVDDIRTHNEVIRAEEAGFYLEGREPQPELRDKNRKYCRDKHWDHNH